MFARICPGHPGAAGPCPWRDCPAPVFRESRERELFDQVMALPAKYRLPLYLYYYEGYSIKEVGELLKVNPSTVQTRLARARARLKTMLTEE